MKRLSDILRIACITFIACTAGIVCCACNDGLDIQQMYAFDLQILPVPKSIVRDETVEIRCTMITEGNYSKNEYFIRYFQPDGKGELRLDDGTLLTPNDLFLLKKNVFRLYYTARCTDAQTVDIYIQDSFGQTVQKTFDFQNEDREMEESSR